MRDRRAADRGSTDQVLVLPVAFLMMAAVLQVGLWAHAQHRVQVIAEQGVAAARSHNATARTGQAAAEGSLKLIGGALLHAPDIQVTRGPDRAEAVVTARITSLVPGWRPRVHAFSTAPVERIPREEQR